MTDLNFEQQNSNHLQTHTKDCLFIVDDDENYLSILSKRLQQKYQVLVAKDAKECLNILSSGNEPKANLFLLDIYLPEMTGIELCTKIRAIPLHQNTPIMLISGRDHEENRINGYKAGADSFLKKPYSYAEIEAHIQTLLRKDKIFTRWEEEILKNTKLASIGLNSIEIVHNLKNAMTGLVGYLDLIIMNEKDENFNKERAQELYHMIHKSHSISLRILESMKFLLTNVKDSYQHKNALNPINLNEIIKQEIEIYNIIYPYEKHGIKIEFIPKDIPYLQGIAPQFSHIFNNLIKNAIEALKDLKGHIRFETSYDNNEKKIIISMTDTGKGMNNQTLTELFLPFKSTKEKVEGTGLGLYSVKKTIEDYGGIIEVKSELGVGTNILMKLPASSMD